MDISLLKNNNINTENTINEDEKSLISIISKNTTGVISKIASFCSENLFNIEKLVASTYNTEGTLQKIILYISGNRIRVNSLISNLEELDFIISVTNFQSNLFLERELMLIKINMNNLQLQRIMALIGEYKGITILLNSKMAIFQFTSNEEKNLELIERLENLTPELEVVKSGLIATSLT